MPRRGKRQKGNRIHPVRWLPSAWDRIQEAAALLTERECKQTKPTDVIRDGTLRYVDEVLADQSAQKAS